MSRCKSCDEIMNRHDMMHVESKSPEGNVYSELCSRCRGSSRQMYSILNKEYQHEQPLFGGSGDGYISPPD